MITLEHVSKTFPDQQGVSALADITLSIERGETVSMVGPSGSGKSTLLNLIGGLDRPSSGRVVVDGRVVSDCSDHELTIHRRDTIGFVFQSFHLLPSLSCLENVALPLHLRGWSRRRATARARDLLDLVRLGARTAHVPEKLSGGERQRVAIARALAGNPPLLLADEPTGNLDSATGSEILQLMHDLHERIGTTILLVTHDMTVARTCARLLTLRDGRLASDERLATAAA